MANQRNSKGEHVGILWCDYTINLWWGCVKVHEGCDNCYAERLSHRWGYNLWGDNSFRKEIKGTFSTLNKIQKHGEQNNVIYRVFVGSMMDIFEKPVPVIGADGRPVMINDSIRKTTDDIRQELFSNISKGLYKNILFLFLTKRPSNINKYIPEIWKHTPPDNVMFGTSPVNQSTFNNLVGHLQKVNGKKFLSVEPQLGHISIETLGFRGGGINWIIQGGESGPHKRPFNLQWARSMRDECKTLGIAYFFKQIDKVQDIPEDLLIREFP